MNLIGNNKINEVNIGYLSREKNDYERVYVELETQKQLSFSDINDMTYEDSVDELSNNRTIKNLTNPNLHLHHSIGFLDNEIGMLEFFLQQGKIVSGKDIPHYYCDPMNSNEGKYISLLAFKGINMEYSAFIIDTMRISFMINPIINPLEAKYVCEEMFSYISKNHKEHKNRYAWCRNEFHIESIDFENIDSLGIPYYRYRAYYGEEYANEKLEEIITLLNKYGYNLPIYDNATFKVLSEPIKCNMLKK